MQFGPARQPAEFRPHRQAESDAACLLINLQELGKQPLMKRRLRDVVANKFEHALVIMSPEPRRTNGRKAYETFP